VVNLRAFRSLTLVLAKLALRDPTSVFFSLALAPALLVLFGLAFGDAPVPLQDGLAAIDHQLPAIAAWVFAMTGLFTVPMAVVTRRESGTLRRLQATPLRPATFVAADVSVHLVQVLAGLALLFAVGVLVFGARPTGATAPLEVMPQGVRAVAALNPLHHAVSLLRGAWLGEPWSGLLVETAAVAGLLVVAAAVAVARFRWEV